MFKLGGEVNSHGVGLTSGLSYNRPGYNGGGTVEPIGSDFYPKVKGPDGKMRESHFLGMGARLGQSGIMALINALKGGYKTGFWSKPGKAFGSMRDTMNRYMRLGRTGKGVEGLKAGEFAGMPTQRAIDAALKSGDPKKIKAIKDAMFKYGTPGKVLRGAELAVAPAGLGLAGAGLGSALMPDISEEWQEKVPLLNLLQGGRDWLLEPALDFTPLGGLTYGLTGESPTSGIDKLMGRDKTGPITADDTKGPVARGIETQQEEFAALKADAEKRAQLYMDLLGEEPDRMGAISRGLIQAGQLWDEDRGAAVGALGTEAGAETQRIKDLEDQFRGMAVQEVVGGDLAQQQALDQAKVQLLSDPQLTPDMRAQGLKGIEAYEEGITDVLPLNAKQDAADGSKLSEGSVYYDPTNLYGGMYVGVSSNPDDPDGQVQGFDSAEEAKAHAAG